MKTVTIELTEKELLEAWGALHDRSSDLNQVIKNFADSSHKENLIDRIANIEDAIDKMTKANSRL